MTWQRTQLIAGGLTTLFIIFGIFYSIFTPIFENSDETLHFPYVKHLADGLGLPLAVPGQLWNQEATQPPLYYALAAAATFWIDTANLPEHLQENPHWLFTEVRRLINDNQNRVLHGPMDAFPYRHTALAVHVGRWLSLLFGAVTVLCTWFIARCLFPHSLPLAVTATAITALTPQFLRVSATVSNDSLSAALASLAVLLALRFTAPGQNRPIAFTNRHALILGLVAGLALLTKLSSLSTFVLVAGIIFWRLFFLGELHQRPWQNLLRWLLLAAAVTALLNGWYLWRNHQLYGEWLATETHLNLAGRGYLSLPQIWNLRAEIERAYWATFGWGQIRLPEWLYLGFGLFTRLGLLGLLGAIVYKIALQRPADETQPGHRQFLVPLSLEAILFLLVWAAMNLVLYVRWVSEVGSVSHTRLIFPAITAISILLALGWHTLIPRRWHAALSMTIIALMAAINIYALAGVLAPAFSPDAPPAEAAILPLDATFAAALQLTGGAISGPPQTPTLTTAWRVIAPPDKNYSVSAVLLAPDGRVLAHRETFPGLGLRPTRYLTPGQTFVDHYPLTVTAPLTEPLVARAVIGLFDFHSPDRAGLPALDAAGRPVTPVIGHLKLTPNLWPVDTPQHPAAATFGGAIQLTGYTIDPAGLTLSWQALAPVAEDYTLFIHLLDAEGNLIAQADAPPTSGRYPTGWWSPGETITDRHPLPAAPGAIAVRLGLYRQADGQRLPVTDSSLPVQDNGVTIPLD